MKDCVKALSLLLAGFLVMLSLATSATALLDDSNPQHIDHTWTTNGTKIYQVRTIWPMMATPWFSIYKETVFQNGRLVAEREHLYSTEGFLASESNRTHAASSLCYIANVTGMSLITSSHNQSQIEDILEKKNNTKGFLTFVKYADGYVKPVYPKK